MTLIATRTGLVNVANVNCPRCHGKGWWMEFTQTTIAYQPFCNCAEEMKAARDQR